MASPDSRPCVGDVRIAIICALKLEYDAVKLAYEHMWEDDKTRDGYGYSTGRIGGHVSLLVCCEAGKASAAGVASIIRSRYRGIKLAIVAGICGGVPRAGTDKELLLGDVVISTSIFQHDYGRRNTDKFRPKQGIEDALPVPGREICSFLNMLQTRDAHKKLQSETNRILQEIQRAEPKTYECPEDTEDYLYEADYVHKHRNSSQCDCDESVVCDQALEATCEELGCKDSFVVRRPRRNSSDGSLAASISVRFGGVGSGDTVMKSGRDRDDMAKRHNLIALEMEGAGVRKHINDSIVVKSVCDYSDSHKNKNWQNFAAAAAASTTKALLERFSCEEEPETPTDRGNFKGNYERVERELLPLLAAEHERYKDFNPERVQGTCEWFFKDQRFLEWLDSPSGTIWISAGPGCGKSVLAKALIDEQRLSKAPEKATVCYFFFKAGEERRAGSSDAISAVLHQLFDAKRGSELIRYAEGPFTSYKESLRNNFHRLWDILTNCAKSSDAGEIVCVLDALDECDEAGRQEILMKLKALDKAQSRLKFLITGRPYDYMEDEFKRLSQKGLCIQLDGDEKSEEIREEINLVIDHKVKIIAEHWDDFGVEHRQQLLERLKEMNNRTYLWLHLTMGVIEKHRSRYRKYSSIKRLLEQLPLDTFEAYEKILNHSQDEVKARCLFQIILAAKQPLTLQELNYCLALQEEQFSGDVPYVHDDLLAELEPSTTFASTIRNLCGLFISVHDGKVSFIHKTARDFLLTESESQTSVWQGKFRLASSHNVMFVSCVRLISLQDFDILAEATPYIMDYMPYRDGLGSLSIEQSRELLLLTLNHVLPFASYAVLNWPDHYNSQDEEDKDKFLKEARGLCYIPERQGRAPSWFELRHEFLLPHGIDSWTDLTFSTFLGLFEVVVHILDVEKVDVNEPGGQLETAVEFASAQGHVRLIRMLCQHGADFDALCDVFRTALLKAASRSQLEVIQRLLDESTGAHVDQELITAAEEGFWPSKEMMSFLLDKCPDAKITHKFVLSLAVTEPDAMHLFLERYRENIKFTAGPLQAEHLLKTLRLLSTETLALLIDMCGDMVQITPKLVEEVARSSEGKGTMCLLLERYGDMVSITPNVVMNAADSSDGDELLGFLLEKFGDKVEITVDVLTTVADNGSMGKETMAFLLEKGPIENLEHMEEIVDVAAGNRQAGDEVVTMLLEKYGDLVKITPSILYSAAAWGSHKTMALLLEKREHEIQVTQEVILAIVGNDMARVEMIALLLEKGGEEVRITQEVLIAAAKTGREETVHFLLQSYGNEVQLTRDVIKAAKWNDLHRQQGMTHFFSGEYGDREDVMAWLLDKDEDMDAELDEEQRSYILW